MRGIVHYNAFCLRGDFTDISELLRGVDCSCGKHHKCDIKYVYIENGAISRLSEVCAKYSDILLVADENTYHAAGKKTEEALLGKKINRVIFSGNTLLVPDEKAIETAQKEINSAQIILGVGSGVIQDLCKYLSSKNKIPYIIVATAPSMDGYASDGAAMILCGMKETVKSGLPYAIIADTQVLKNAPIEMIKAGYGDIVGKFSALNDWSLSRLVTGEYFCQYIYDLTLEQVQKTLDLAEGLLKRDEQSIKVLMEALVIIGVMMSFAGSSRPASGSEHHLSHFFEITGIVDHTKYLPHGIDVAYSTVITALLREKLLNTDFKQEIKTPKESERNEKLKEIYKQVAVGCIRLQEKLGNYTQSRSQAYIEKEKAIKEIFARMPTAKEIEQMLALVGLDMREFLKFYGKEKLKNAVFYAKDLKDRYSVLWVYYDFFAK